MIFLRAFFSALLRAIFDAIEEAQKAQAYEEALKENARFDAEARTRAGEKATRERIRNVEPLASDDDGALRDWLREHSK